MRCGKSEHSPQWPTQKLLYLHAGPARLTNEGEWDTDAWLHVYNSCVITKIMPTSQAPVLLLEAQLWSHLQSLWLFLYKWLCLQYCYNTQAKHIFLEGYFHHFILYNIVHHSSVFFHTDRAWFWILVHYILKLCISRVLSTFHKKALSQHHVWCGCTRDKENIFSLLLFCLY